jgi:hypothetical protein
MLFLSGCELEGDSSAGENENYKYQAACWQAAIVQYVMQAADSLFSKAKSLAVGGEAGAAVICISFSIWMALKLLKVLPSFKEHNLGEVWTEIGHKLFVCGFCALILVKVDYLNEAMNAFVFPIYNTIIELGSNTLNAGIKGGSTVNLGDYGPVTFETASGCATSSSINATSISGGIGAMSKCMVCAIKDRLNIGVKIAIAMICSGGIGSILTGLTVLLLFSGAKLFFVLYLVDGLFRLNFAVFLLPILVMGIPFSYTRKWSKHCFLMFINSSGVMLFLGLLISVSINALVSVVTGISSVTGGSFTSANVAGRGPVLLSILLIATLLVNIPGIAVALADKFIGGGGGLEFQKKISKFVFTVARRIGAGVVSYFTAGIANQVNEGLEKYETVRNIKDRIKMTKEAFNERLNSLAGYNDD